MERTEGQLHIHASRQSLLIRLDPPEQQLPAREVLQNSLTSGYSIVLILPLTPSHWAGEFVGFPLNQGSNPA
ncbi:hypothetical protein M5J15_11990 [Serratia symbiotica]|uniref:hypothetical protein n=1 Tax=Serratia symbiotica TaxID=138074 RepID=UPI0020901273|nr:hypothetical protein [Serratia symbiotica]USS95251.1 hypothetical protein M5J15_11990 [Serratia symbiotica]